MRLFFLIGWSLLLAAAPALGQSAGPPSDVRRTFEEGNRRYADGAYETALRQYERILEGEWTSGALHYNAAGAHYRLGHLGRAVQHYEKARRLLPENERLRHNLGVVRSQLAAPPPAPRSLTNRARATLSTWVPPVVVLAAGLLVYLAALVGWVLSSSNAAQRFRPRAGVAALLGAGLGLIALGFFLSAPASEGRAVVLRGSLTLRDAPTPDADSTAALPEGTVLRLAGREDDWTKVHSSRGNDGWTRTDALGEI